jgi:ABC-type multidrug transport system fused ATPase/permease subunit
MADPGFGELMAVAGRDARRVWLGCAVAIAGVACRIATYLFFYLALASLPHRGGAGLALYIGLAAASYLASHLLAGLATGISHYAAFDILHGLRRRLLDKLARLPLGYFATRRAGGLKRIVNENVEVLELFFSHQLPDMLAALVVAPATLVLIALVDWRLALAAAAILPVLALANWLMMKGHGPKIGQYFGLLRQINASSVEYLQGIEVIKSARGGDAAFRTLKQRVEAFRDFASDWQKSWMGPWTLFAVTTGAALVFVVPLGLWLVETGRGSAEALLFAVLAATGMGGPLIKLSLYSEIYLRVVKAWASIRDLLAEPELGEAAAAAPFPADHTIRLAGVDLVEDGRTILEGIDLALPANSFSALVGPSGAGKTSLIRLITRQWDATRGTVEIGGVNVQSLALGELIGRIAVISQDVFLFNDSILENIRLGRAGATEAEAIAAARAARLHEFVATLPEGYATMVGENGARLSGGQRQRLALARALLRDAPILVLDEVTADVDPYHERLIQAAVNALAGRKTVVIVSHRLDSVRHCRHLALVIGGKIAAAGSHDALLAASDAYRELWATQQANLRWTLGGQGAPAPVGAVV